MEEGSLRCDCNVSVRHPGAPLGTSCEIKNLTRSRFSAGGSNTEARRQVALIEEGGAVQQGTRLYDRRAGRPAMRSKENDYDYAISPTPTCCRWCWSRSGSTGCGRTPELPDAKKAVSSPITASRSRTPSARRRARDAEYFEKVAQAAMQRRRPIG